MKIKFIFVGTNKGIYVEEGIDLYKKRLKRFTKLDFIHTSNLKGIKNPQEQKDKECAQILKNISQKDFLVLLDEKGKRFSSLNFANEMESLKNQGTTQLSFVICGAFGANDLLKKRANLILSLSDLTYSHQLARVVLLEQVYRMFTIIHKHPYHNEG